MTIKDDQFDFVLTGQLLYRAVQVADQLLSQSVGDHLTSRQLSILLAVNNLNSPTQMQVVSATGIDRSTVSDVAARLVKRGWLSRQRVAADKRRYAVKLTPAGKQAIKEVLPIARKVDSQFLAALTMKEQQQLNDLLRKICVTPALKKF